MTLQRTVSQETLATRTDLHDLHTFHSHSSTIADSAFGRGVQEFNHIRTLPVVSPLFKKGLYVFPSDEALSQYKSDTPGSMPLLKSVQTSSLAFKKAAQPIMTFYKYTSPKDRFVYCRVLAKNMRDEHGVTRYTLQLTPNGQDEHEDNFDVVIFSCTNAPVNDCVYKNTKLRWVGSTLSEPVKSFKLLLLSSETPSLCDGMDMSNPVPNTEAKIDFGLKHTDIPPLARFVEHRPPSKLGLTQTADVKAIEVFDGASKDSVEDVPESTLVVACMSMLLEEQRKNMGSSKSYDTTMFS